MGGNWKGGNWNNRPKYQPVDDPSLHGYGNKYIPGEGPTPCDVMLVGGGPSATDDQLQRAFVGPTGRLLDKLLAGEGLNRDEIYLTNVTKYHTPGDREPSARDILRDAQDLQEEVTGETPRIIGLLGAVAVREFLPGVSLEWGHGLVFPMIDEPSGMEAGYYMPLYNPAYAFRSPDAMVKIQSDFHEFKRLIRGTMTEKEMEGAHDEYPSPVYLEIPDTNSDYIPLIFAEGDTNHNWCSIDTEGYYWAPWCLSFSVREGAAWVITNKNKQALTMFMRALRASGRRVVLHNSLHDLEVLAALGVEVDPFIDTMVNAYHLCVEPQGLKPLMRRYRGAEQMDYDEVMGPAIRRVSFDYLEKVREWWQNKTSADASQLSLALQPKPQRKARKSKRTSSASAGKK